MKKRTVSALLAVSMVLGILVSALPSITVSAASTIKDFAPGGINYLTDSFESKEAKLETMEMLVERFGYQLWYEKYTGEVAVKNVRTGDILMTNPYDVGGAKASDNIKSQLLSQIILKYSTNEGSEISMYSYVEAAQRSQINQKYIKNGIRVEYVMGKRESRSLVPRYIEKSRFEEMILANIDVESKLKKINAYYILKDPNEKDAGGQPLSDKAIEEMYKAFPITKKMAIYVFDSTSSEREINTVEAIIKEFCPAYTYEELEYDHQLTEYESEDKNPVQFRLSLEYTLDEDGLSVRLPANGIRFDQSSFQLSYIRILPYMGAASSEFTGYTMIPDGSGALVRFEDVLKSGSSRILAGKLYGQDYAYHTITGANQRIMRMPVFGIVENTEYVITPEEPETPVEGGEGEPAETPADTPAETPGETPSETPSETLPSADPDDDEDEEQLPSETPGDTETETEPEVIKYNRSTGYFAIIESGDSLATITTDHGGNVTHKYNSVYTEFNPRPKDSYNLASAISVAGNAVWTVVSERKFTGNFRIRYIMLSDLDYLSENGVSTDGLFGTDYVGMAKAYRYMLEKQGTISKLGGTSQIPLYLETLGVMDSEETILSIPVTVKKPLTTFDDIRTITGELGEEGINNLVYKLTGYVNGGLSSTLSRKIKVERKAGGNDGLKSLIEYGKEKGIEFYLDIDFSYTGNDKLGDGFSRKRDAVKTIDGRYSTKRTYSATYQYFRSTGLIVISPSVFTSIFEDAEKYLENLGVTAVSLSTVGSDLNSDFDEDDPYNREDSKENVVKALSKIKEDGYKVMLDAGNAYVIPYSDHVLNVSLDSSGYTYASETIPFFGMVYHGYLLYAGNATNTAGDMRHEKLKILENGANPYFILVYQNSEKLKEDKTLSNYFSISYTNWKKDMIATYKELNEALSLVFNSPVSDHEFVTGERVPSAEEKEYNDMLDALAEEEAKKAEADAIAEEERKQALKEHLNELKGITTEPKEPAPTPSGEEGSDESQTGEEPEETGYVYTRYTVENGLIVRVTFDNGYKFVINYNDFDVTTPDTGDTVIHSLGYIVVSPDGDVVINSAKEAAE